MEFSPPSHRSEPRSRTKSASRLARMGDLRMEGEEIPRLSVDLVSPKKDLPPSTPSLRSSASLPVHELLLLSPSPVRRSKTRLADRLEMPEDPVEAAGLRRRKTKASHAGFGSPRAVRRSRRRSEVEIGEDKDAFLLDGNGKARKRRHSKRLHKEKLSLVPSMPSASLSPQPDDNDRVSLDQLGQLITDLIMWKDVAKSSLWFGVGCLCFLSSCFATGISYSIFTAVSQLGLLLLGASFFSNSICQRNNTEKKHEFKLKEEDISRILKVMLPPANLAISKISEHFSGEPSTTLKVAPFLLLGAEYGHLITLWRLCAIGFFISFTAPKLYSCYYIQIQGKVDCCKWCLFDAWEACSHKKIVIASAVTAFWNLASLKTRIFAAFISLVILRYCRQHAAAKLDGEVGEEEEQQALALVEAEQKQADAPLQRALIVAEAGSNQ